MRVLITGANGSAGRVAVTAIKEAGHFVRGFDRAAREGDGVYDRSPSEARWHAPPDEFVQVCAGSQRTNSLYTCNFSRFAR